MKKNMKRFYFRFKFLLMTLALGLANVWFFNNIKITDNEDIRNATIVTIAPKQPKFTESFRGCGFGYVQGFFSNNGIELTEGNLGCNKPKKRDKRVVKSDDDRIISKIETGDKTYFEIYQLENGHCINSPTIELGIELENYLKNNP